MTFACVTDVRRARSQRVAEAVTSPARTRRFPSQPPAALCTSCAAAPNDAAAGKVTSQATTIRRAVDHRTSDPRPTPDPTFEPLATCVVDSG